MKKVLSILVVVFFVGSLLAQQAPAKSEQKKPAEKAKTECCKGKEGKKDKACCAKTKGECKDAKKDSTKCTAAKKTK
jgi:hypothetical protein